jgi:hypothetical protein
MHFVTNPGTSLGVYKPQSVLRALRLNAMFAALASTSCLAEDANIASAAHRGGFEQAFRSKTLVKDASFSFTFATAGDYSYLCSIHPNMKGKVIVKPAS